MAPQTTKTDPYPTRSAGFYAGVMPILPFESSLPTVGENVFLAPSATLIGEVRIDEGVAIMFGAIVRADRAAISVGSGSNLQDNVVIHGDPGFPTVIGSDVSVGHGAIVHGATVENNCLIGMGATVLNGAVIGEGSLIAAGTVVLEGTVVPPGSLVAGVPGKIRRSVSADEVAAIGENARTYQRLGAAYREASNS